MYQKLILVGNLGKDPEMRYTPTGQAVTSFNIATNRQYTGADGQLVKETIWFKVSVWGKQAEACQQYLKKGNKALVEGRLQADKQSGGPRVWTRQDGTPGASFEITADTVRFLSSPSESGRGGEEEHPAAGGAEEDIPF